MNESGKKVVVKTWARASMISPDFVGHTVAVHNGNKFIPVYRTAFEYRGVDSRAEKQSLLHRVHGVHLCNRDHRMKKLSDTQKPLTNRFASGFFL